jgi:hypothetical protein
LQYKVQHILNKETRKESKGASGQLLTTAALHAYKESSRGCRGLFLAESHARDQNDMMMGMLKIDASKNKKLGGTNVACECVYFAAKPAKSISGLAQCGRNAAAKLLREDRTE